MLRITRCTALVGILILLALVTVGCSELADPLKRQGGDGSNCVACHTDQEILEANVEPDSSQGEDPGEG